MFKSISEFDKAIYKLLKGIYDEKPLSEIESEIGENFNDALEECIDRGYLKGVHFQSGQISVGNPRLSYEGLQRYESKF